MELLEDKIYKIIKDKVKTMKILQAVWESLPEDETKYCRWQHDKSGIEFKTCAECQAVKKCLSEIKAKFK